MEILTFLTKLHRNRSSEELVLHNAAYLFIYLFIHLNT